ncbi:MAG: hypothetical protein K6T94_26455 [Paenibacillus sp.]|nr:hypothetical protein [Paenibacillus sp.]
MQNNKHPTYKIIIELKSSTITPFQSDTLFGQICWSILRQEGPDYLQELFLEAIRSGEQFLISSAMPEGYLPRPILPPQIIADEEPISPSEQNSRYIKAKEFKKTAFIKEEFFEQNKNLPLTENNIIDFYLDQDGRTDGNSSNNGVEKVFDNGPSQFTQVLVKNAINRNNFTTIEGLLFAHRETFAGRMQIFVRLDPSLAKIDEVVEHLDNVGRYGFGKRASTGKGAFKVIDHKEYNLPEASKPNAFMTLSNYVPFDGDPRNGWYSLLTKWGKLGGEFSINGNPFKYPLAMYAPGSVFKLSDGLKPSYGGLLPNVSKAFSEAVQYVFAFPLGVVV